MLKLSAMKEEADCVEEEDHTPLLVDEEPPVRPRKQPWMSCRRVVVLYCFVAYFVVYAMRVNLSVAIVTMVNQTFAMNHVGNITHTKCERDERNDSSPVRHQDGGKFNWDEETQGLILSSFFFGYVVTQIPSGWLTVRFGGKRLLGYGVLSAAFLSFLTPLVARTNVYLLMGLRGLMGLSLGGVYPAGIALLSRWLPPLEHSKYTMAAFSGSDLGNVITLPLCGYFCALTHIDGGWPLAFYVFGALGVLWFVPWMIFIHDSPAEHPRVSLEERNFIEEAMGFSQDKTAKKVPVPWLAILLSPAVWSLCIVGFVYSFGFYIFCTSLPSFYKEVLDFSIEQNGFLSALPFLATFASKNSSGVFADWLRERRKWSTTLVRKLSALLGFLLAAGFLVPIGFLSCDQPKALSVSLLTLSAASLAIVSCMLSPNTMDLSPRFSGFLMGIGNTCSNVAGILSPYIIGLLTNHQPTRGQWQKVFFITSGLYILGIVVFLVFGSGKVQSWNNPTSNLTAPVTSSGNLEQPLFDPLVVASKGNDNPSGIS